MLVTTPCSRAPSPGWACRRPTASKPGVIGPVARRARQLPDRAQGQLGPGARAGGACPRPADTAGRDWSPGVTRRARSAIASSLGISAVDRSTACYLSAVAVAGEGAQSQIAYGYTVGRSPSELDPDKAASDAVTRAVRLLGAVKPRSAHVPVVLEPRVTAQVARPPRPRAQRGNGAEGDLAFRRPPRRSGGVAPLSRLVDDPTEPAAWGAAAFDDEGLACRRNMMIEDGVLRCFLYDSTSARRAGTSSTASAVRAGYKSAPRRRRPGHLPAARDRSAPRKSCARSGTGSSCSPSWACTRVSTP